MLNKAKRYFSYIFESRNPIYIEEKSILDIVKNYPYFEIDSSNQSTFVEELNKFINKDNSFIIIDTDNIDNNNQIKLSCMVKDRTYQTINIPYNVKIIVTGNKDNINKELFGLLGVVDV